MSSYTLHLPIHKKLLIDRLGQNLSLEEYTTLLWVEFKQSGLLGIYEGTILPNSPSKKNSDQELQLYFSSQEFALKAQEILSLHFNAQDVRVEEIVEKDWNQEWNESFDGAIIEPYFEIIPNGKTAKHPHLEPITLNVGAGFGAGTHETTQLCLERLGNIGDLYGQNTLDFGCGSGILGIAAAIKGSWVDAVEIDEMALKNAKGNAALNDVFIQFHSKLPQTAHKTFDLILANILQPVLIANAPKLCHLLNPKRSTMVLSGLLKKDLQHLKNTYAKHLPKQHSWTVFQKMEWFAIEIKLG